MKCGWCNSRARCASGRSPCGERGLKSCLPLPCASSTHCRSPCGERGLKFHANRAKARALARRSPCGERGLKYPAQRNPHRRWTSLPVRGAWIEIGDEELLITHGRRRSPCGERGLKCDGFLLHVGIRRRSPCGERGLKYCPQFPCRKNPSSRSPCGERGLKSTQRGKTRPPRTVAPRAGSVD